MWTMLLHLHINLNADDDDDDDDYKLTGCKYPRQIEYEPRHEKTGF